MTRLQLRKQVAYIYVFAAIKTQLPLEDYQYTNNPSIAALLMTVRTYCHHIEKETWANADTFIKVVHPTLLRLYSWGLELPEIGLSKWYADIYEVQEDVLNNALQQLKRNTPFQYYWTVLNPLAHADPVYGTGDLIDDLYDIYKELKYGLLYFDEVEGFQEFALWHLHTSFYSHWSDHCISAANAIHEYLYNKDIYTND